ncbi:DUF455 domain-containing protein [Xylariaceae sp. FL1651]|nr:DUF455 domain-containing protein [Xylariaceae sp. FL1651]
MATDKASSRPKVVPIGSHDTALCIVPPKHLWPAVDRLRSLYDKAFQKWPPHINLVYPFVHVEDLSMASELITSRIKSAPKNTDSNTFKIRLDTADVFPHRRDTTIFIYDNDKERISRLEELRKLVLSALGQNSTNYRMHMTIGQSQNLNAAPHKFLLEKASLLPAVEWTFDKLYILIRERMQIDGNAFSQMKVWGTMDLNSFTISRAETFTGFYETGRLISTMEDAFSDTEESGSLTNRPYTFSTEEGKWVLLRDGSTEVPQEKRIEPFTIASYNVLAEFEHPPSKARYPIAVENILQQSIVADILVLQEVTDDFLSFICQNDNIRKHYRYTTSGPPNQPDIEPLPSHLNVVVLSRWPFSWSWLPFHRRHKGSIILKLNEIGKQVGDVFLPTILSTVHLTCGLTDGSVSSKKLELKAILAHLSKNFPRNPWIMAGDFNITTSAYTIEAALKKKAISSQTATYLKGLDNMLTEAGLIDTWTSARVQNGEYLDSEEDFKRQTEIFEGEQGATFDPTVNSLAAEIVGSGFNNRPQRYDRILLKSEDLFVVIGFTMFGRRLGHLHEGTMVNEADSGDTSTKRLSYASDHWGVRCSLKINRTEDNTSSDSFTRLSVPIHLSPASNSLDNASELKDCLNELGAFPLEADATKRREALELLRAVVLENDNNPIRGKPAFVIVPVGSYGLGVWTTSSDIDCLCIGPISSRTFFALATQRLRKAASKGVRLLRRVNAHSGTMLELEVLDFKMDLQYCPSSIIAETWPHTMKLPPTDPVFTLPTQALAKLKPVRDMYYIRRTIPDYTAFRTAHYLIKLWAKQQGIYSAKFGLLGGIQISVLLSRVCKLLSHDGRSVSLPSLLTTFFNHYASFDWSTQLVFDPFFHKQLRYTRTTREPMAILGFHPPSLNTTNNASRPSVRTITDEFKRADALLSQEGMTWTTFLSANRGPSDFLATFKTFVKIDVQFWGVSLAKGSSFVGWLESRCVMLLVDLNRRVPNVHARIWPARFVDKDSSEDETDYQGCYLIGLDRWGGSEGESMSKDDMKAALGLLHAALQKFEGQIRGDEKYFDPNTSWMSASLVNRTELGVLHLDNREWGEYTIGEDESDEEEEEEEDETFTSDDGERSDPGALSSRSKPKRKVTTTSLPTRPAYSGKFRSSADVINRIRWDPDMHSSDYIVGYEDRFLGTKERALDMWKSEQTDEEFIPQHRILYFKRKSDEVVVWDRKERRDIVFGSGISSINAGQTEAGNF